MGNRAEARQAGLEGTTVGSARCGSRIQRGDAPLAWFAAAAGLQPAAACD